MTGNLGDNPFDELLDDIEGLEGEVTAEELFPPTFIQTHSEFSDFEEFLDESRWEVESSEDFEEIPDGPFDEYVADTTDFEDWEEMLGTAGNEWAKDQLGL